MAAPFCKFYGKILVSFCLNTGKGCFLEVSFSSQQKEYTLLRKKKSEKTFVGEKFSHFWKFSHFSPTNFSNASLFPNQFLKLKGLSWVWLIFFQRKVVLLVWDFSNWTQRSALLVSLIYRIGCCKYTPSWISQNKKFLYKLIFRGYKIFRRIPEEF